MQLSKETQWCDHIHLPLLTSRIFQELICQDSIKISIRSSPKSSRSHSWVTLLSDSTVSLRNHLSSIHQEVILESHCLVTHQCHQEVNCHFTIIIDLRLEVFSVLFKFYTTWSHCAKQPLVSWKWKYKLFCVVVRK